MNRNFNRKLVNIMILSNFLFKIRKKLNGDYQSASFFHFSPKNGEMNEIRRVNYTPTIFLLNECSLSWPEKSYQATL
jgi:hypothetical protein